MQSLAFATGVVTVLPATATWATGRLLGGTGSAWKTILFGTLAGAAVGVPLTFATYGAEGWLVGQLVAIAVSIPTFHLTYRDVPADGSASRDLSIGVVPTPEGAALTLGGRF